MTFCISFSYTVSGSQPFRGRKAHASGVEVKLKKSEEYYECLPKGVYKFDFFRKFNWNTFGAETATSESL